ncbi:MAG: aminotransferase class V-fold PLP-dependent enzyme [Rickettsiales bacterium]|jgi:cysteine desulfurase/selenocysteine lyase|nr:aminotransferase class V-fold PLP-dependent enzyme [Rickettsiales bacterium]
MRNGFGDISGVYADAAASALKPAAVVAAEGAFMTDGYANAGRGICPRAGKVDEMVRRVRERTAAFIGARRAEQIVFTRGATEGLNRLANMLRLKPDDVVIVSDLDHHSARLPFQTKCRIEVCPLDENFNLDSGWLCSRCKKGDVRAVVITAMSNVMGTAQDLKKLIAAAGGAFAIVDAAQYVAHEKLDVGDAGAVVFSAHKMGAGTGLGVLYIRDPDALQSDFIGGGSVAWVDGDKFEYAAAPEKFEAGTLPMVQIAGFEAALPSVSYEDGNTAALRGELETIPGIKIVSPVGASLISFYSERHHALDIGAALGAAGICVRAGQMCASWIHKRIGIEGSVRISLGPWNDAEDAKKIAAAVKKVMAA